MVINIHDDSPPPAKSGGCGSGGCSSGTCGEGLEKVYPTAVVRYGYMKQVGEFRYPNSDMKFGCGAKVIIQTNRGIEFGEMVSVSCDGCDKCVSREQIRSYVNASGPDYFHFSNGKILRLASSDDQAEWEHIRADTLSKKRFCQERSEHHRLPLKVLECEHLFGGERIIFYFMAEGRVDFRSLVREMADEFQTRIEMRQVGARDEARLLADYETCGRECCCKNFLKTLKPISMKMAKMQKATLDPAKVSGRCGRLKCCLRYEHTNYEELDRMLPRIGAKVMTSAGRGTVVARQILTQLLQVMTDDGGSLAVAVEDLVRDAPDGPRRPPIQEAVESVEEMDEDLTDAPAADMEQPPAATDQLQEQTPSESVSGASEERPRRRRGGRRRNRRRRGNRPEGGGDAPSV